MRQCGENHRLFTASEFLPIDLRFEPSVDDTPQIRMRGGKWLSIQAARCSTDAAHLWVAGEPVEELAATIAGCAEDNGVNFHAAFPRRGRILFSTMSPSCFGFVRALHA